MLLGNKYSGMFEQLFQNRKCLRTQGYCSAALPQALVQQVKSEISKTDVFGGLHQKYARGCGPYFDGVGKSEATTILMAADKYKQGKRTAFNDSLINDTVRETGHPMKTDVRARNRNTTST